MDNFLDGDDEILKEFLVESHENIEQFSLDLIALEENPRDAERLGAIFRCLHTIKGTCGFFGFGKLESISHVAENLLSKLRDGEVLLNTEMTSALLLLVDAIREILSDILDSGNEGNGDYSQLVQTLVRLCEGNETVAEAEVPAKTPAIESTEETGSASNDPVAETIHIDPTGASVDDRAEVASESVTDTTEPPPTPEETRPKQLGEILVDDCEVEALDVAGGLLKQLEGDQRKLGEILIEDQGVQAAQVSDALTTQEIQKSQQSINTLSDGAIRVDVNLLDKLMNMVGELVLSRNQVLQFATSIEDASFIAASQRLNLITSELQEGVMKTRMQPISAVWSKFPRVVRDLATSSGKNISLEMEGKNTELDKSILEAIKDPLTHIVRNSVDHGIEMPEERERNGKSAEGHLLLRAYHEGGQVIIELIDDGAGIDEDRVREKAIERGLITVSQAEKMGTRELVNLIFLPGFSTAQEVTNISGRGVGMDVVKTNIEKIGGTVDVHSEAGKGTTLRIKIPLTLAIIPALIVTNGGDRYAIPQVNLLELVRLEGVEVAKRIEMLHGSPVYRLRGNLLPLVYLDKALNVEPCSADDLDTKDEDRVLNIVVLQAEERQFGLIVEFVHDTEEIVVKPLGKQLKDVSVFAGATIMGDGKVALILDVMGLAHASSVISEVRQRTLGESENAKEDTVAEEQLVLLFQCGAKSRMAIPLKDVARLEKFERSSIETVGTMDVVQYRDEILPLIRVSEVFNEPLEVLADGEEAETGDEKIEAVVYSENGRTVGLIVESVLDITDASFTSRGRSSREGVMFTAVIHEKVTEFVDLKYIIRSAIPDFFEEHSEEAALA